MSEQAAEKAHNPVARYCVEEVGIPVSELRDDVTCPACDAMSALVDLDPDFGPASEGRPNLRSTAPYPCGHEKRTSGCGGCDPGAVEFIRDDGDRTWSRFPPGPRP